MFCVKTLRLASFRAVLDELGDAAPDDDQPPQAGGVETTFGRSPQREQFSSLLNGMARGREDFVSPSHMSRLYAEARSGAASERRRRLSEAETVAEDLRLRPGLTKAELRRIRRKFAFGNHPDRVPPSSREAATRRMIIANALIDQALKARTV
jgi:hypothetical protein